MSINLDLEHQVTFKEHRSGWAYAIDALRPLHHDYGVLMDGFLECSHAWRLEEYYQKKIVPYREPWVGFLHNPPNMPKWFDWCNSPQVMLNRDVMKESMKYCKGLYVLSDYFREWLAKQVDVPVNTLIHPTEGPSDGLGGSGNVKRWTSRRWRFNNDRKIIALGWWMRQIHSIRRLMTKYSKIWLVPGQRAKEIQRIESLTMDTFRIDKGRYKEVDHVPDGEYDTLLAENIAFVHLYDASACNSLIECVVRNTPLLINPIPSVVEYLGEDYPLYFNDLEEAGAKADDDDLVLEAHKYMMGLDKTVYTQEHFRESFENSEIYQSIING